MHPINIDRIEITEERYFKHLLQETFERLTKNYKHASGRLEVTALETSESFKDLGNSLRLIAEDDLIEKRPKSFFQDTRKGMKNQPRGTQPTRNKNKKSKRKKKIIL